MPLLKRIFRILIAALILLLVPPSNPSQGIPWYTIPLPIPNGFVDAVSGNVHLEIPLGSTPQRNGDPIVSKLVYDTAYYTALVINQTAYWNGYGAGWGGLLGNSHGGGGSFSSSVESCSQAGFGNYPNGTVTIWSGFYGVDSHRTTHAIGAGYTMQVNCYDNYGHPYGSGSDIVSISGAAGDNSGYQFQITNYSQMVIRDRDATLLYDGTNDQYSSDQMPVDTNGNTGLGSAPNLSSGLPVYASCPSTSTFKTSSGSSASYIFTCTNENVSNVVSGTTYVGTESFLTSVTLPDGTSYTLTYDTGTTGNHYGTLLSVTLPTGGTVSLTYTLTDQGWPSPIKATTVNNGGGTWNLSYVQSNCTTTCQSTTTVLAPSRYDSTSHGNVNDKSVFTSTVYPGGGFYVQTAQYYSGSSTLLRTVTYTPSNLFPSTVTTTLNDTGQSSSVFYQWNTFAPTQKQETDFSGTILRTTNTTFGNFAKPTSINVYAGSGSGSPIASTLYAYDEYSANYCKNGVPMLASFTGAYGHDDANFGTGVTLRGNVTTIQRLILGTTYSTTHVCYDTLGNVTQTVDANGNPTSYDYSENWADTYCIPSGTITHAFPTTITDALGHRTKNSFFTCTVLPQSTKDENDIQANRNGTTLTYELLNRLIAINYSDGGQTTYCYSHDSSLPCYTSALPPFSTESRLISGSTFLNTKTLLDSYGRVAETQLTSDSQGTVYTDTTYDALGHVSTVSNPYRSTGDSTYGISTYDYDALGRTTLVIPPDGTTSANNVATAYAGNCTTVTDQTAKARKSCVDGLGRLTQVFEDPAGLNYETDYAYDTLDNLLTVNQKGGTTNSATWRTRTFMYDSLSRLLCASNPENSSAPCPATPTLSYTTGTTGYFYDANGNLTARTALAPNQTGTATVTTCFGTWNGTSCDGAGYDALNRNTKKSYSDGTTPTVQYGYDGVALSGCATAPPTLTDSNPKGNRTAMCDGAGAESWSHDAMNRVLTDSRTTNSVTMGTVYTYLPYVDGSINTIAYPSSRTLTYSTGSAERPLSVQDNSTSVYYASSVLYAPQGAPSSFTNGPNLYSTHIYDKRLQPCWFYTTTGTALATSTPCTGTATTGNILDFKFNFNLGASDNGSVAGITNDRDATRSITAGYDSLNRLASALTTSTHSTSPANCWGETYSADPWGNLLTVAATTNSNYTGCIQESGFNFTNFIGNNNRITYTGYDYDAPGNLNSGSGVSGISYNAENQLVTAAGVTYKYDGDGKRVQKSGGTLYWYGTSADPLDETDLSGNLANEYVFFGGQRIARRDPSNNVFYYFTDHLGTSRAIAEVASGQSTATLCYDADFYPFGVERTPIVNTCSQNYKFTSKERDSESGLDNFDARYNSSSLGRFMSPDPQNAGAMPASPQTWNAYSYVANNPANAIDPDGLCSYDWADGWSAGSIPLDSFPGACGGPDPAQPPTPPAKKLSIECTDAYDPCMSAALNAEAQPNLRFMKNQGPGTSKDYTGGFNIFSALSCAAANDPSDPACWGVRVTLKGGMFQWSWGPDAYAGDRAKESEVWEKGRTVLNFQSPDKRIGTLLVNGDPLFTQLDLRPTANPSPIAQTYICALFASALQRGNLSLVLALNQKSCH
jgi:RHS repeat-associated protein